MANKGRGGGSPSHRAVEAMRRARDAALEEGLPPWSPGRITAFPRNGLTGHRYAGMINLANILFSAKIRGFSDCRFAPVGKLKEIAKRIADKGGEPLDWRGASAVPLAYPARLKRRDDDDEEKRGGGIYFKWFYAINVGEVRGPIEDWLIKVDDFNWASDDAWERAVEYRDSLLGAFKEPPVIAARSHIDYPVYYPGLHEIRMPEFGSYISLEHYLRDLTHELCHASQRELGRIYADGGKACSDMEDDEYKWEELATHLACVGIMLDRGLAYNERREAKYIQGWHDALSSDGGMMARALREGGRIAAFFANAGAADKIKAAA